MFGKKKKKEEQETRALERLMLEVVKAKEVKKQKKKDVKKDIEETYKDFPIQKLIQLLIKKNVIQLKDLESLEVK
ncbi:MAG: hypothetical protein KAI43_09790 [Candidatus Aureabacteria bacterium]|nr:hypothetical protein [Candidatus Auribacterota bacterium]